MLKIFLLFFCSTQPLCYSQNISISKQEFDWIGEKIFQNECGGEEENLVFWNKGEDFASLGIGHFIWYPKNKEGPFDETFPELLSFLKSEGVNLPDWVRRLKNLDCPWNNRGEFIQDLKSQKTAVLREFLVNTIPLQLLFIVNRLKEALPKILEIVSEKERAHIREQFYRVAGTAKGVYALTDYVNFKGEGILETERYKGKGWGLLQVLEIMEGHGSGEEALREFSETAEVVLTQRVRNSPQQPNEQRWLPIWKRRVKTYRN